MAEEIQEEIEVQGPGAMLKARRETLQLSIEEIAEKLHLRPAVVSELEADVIDHSVSMTFTKGYVRLYAKQLEMDPAPVLAAFDELANPIKQPAKLQSFSQRVAKQASDTRLMMLSYFILFAIIAMAVIWWFQQPEESASDSTTAIPNSSQVDNSQETSGRTQEAQPEDTVPEMVTEPETQFVTDSRSVEPMVNAIEPVVESPAQISQSPTEATSDVDQNVAFDAEDTAQSNSGATAEESDELVTDEPQESGSEEMEPANPLAIGNEVNDVARELARQSDSIIDTNNQNDIGDVARLASVDGPLADSVGFAESFNSAEPITQELVFTFEQDCWMNLTDATGENIAYGVKNAGRVMPVIGIPPFEVVLGAPQGVAITVDGVPFDMSEFPAGRTARFLIGAQSETEESAEIGESPE